MTGGGCSTAAAERLELAQRTEDAPAMPFAQLSNVRLEYFPHGSGPEEVVFIHGFQASAPIWRMVQEALPADRYQSIAINNRGAGASEAPPNQADFTVQIFAADPFELLRH